MELVQEIHQMLMDKEETCHRTCFSLQLDGATLDNFNELKNIEGLKDGSVLKLVEGLFVFVVVVVFVDL
jgi:protein TIF31